jgi:hypothetical protein
LLTAFAFAGNLVWQSGFEASFPSREWLDYDEGGYSATGALPPNRASAWSIVDNQSGEPVFAGKRAYKGWITGPAASSHRAYPVVHTDIPTPLVNSFMVYLDVDYGRMRNAWLSLGTWGNYDPIHKTGKWALHTMAIRNRKLEFAHVSPFTGRYLGAAPQAEFPLRRWVRLTLYIQYAGDNGLVQVWQDGTPIVQAKIPALQAHSGTRLRTAHWGLYASGDLDHGALYNDEISICTLDAPLRNLIDEPRCGAGFDRTVRRDRARHTRYF